VEVFEAIAQPRRRQIVELLREHEELTAGEVASRFDVTQPAISQHLKVLREAGLVSERPHGTRRYYRLRPEGLEDLHTFLADFLPSGLERLKREAEAEVKRGGRDAGRN
jgi:DNA-binding transcriptional ArsR family regulator